MNYEWLFSFVVFADTLNFTHAAAQLHISQPALHVQVRKLSQDIGVTLYVRTGRTLCLTAEGERVAGYGREILAQEKALREQLHNQLIGPVILAAGQGAFLYLLGSAVRRFPKKRWPLRLLALKGPDAMTAVLQARAHLGVAVVGEPTHGLECTPLREVGQMAVMPKGHALAHKRRLSPRDLSGHALVVAPAGSPHRQMLEQAMASVGADVVVGVEAEGWQLMLEFARAHMGIAVVNDFCPVPAACVGLPMRGLPSATYSLFHRPTQNRAITRMIELITHGCR